MNTIKIGLLFFALGLFGCASSVNTYTFKNHEELMASEMADGDWFGTGDIPLSATNIEVETDSDLNEAWISFDYDVVKEREFFEDYERISSGALKLLIDQGLIGSIVDISTPVYVNCNTLTTRYIILKNGHAEYLSHAGEKAKQILCPNSEQ